MKILTLILLFQSDNLTYMANLKKIIGERVKSLRKSKGLTQENLAELAEVDQRTISSIENGHSLSYQVLQSIMDALELNPSEFLQFEGLLGLTDDEIRAELLKIIQNLSSSDLRRLYKIVKALDD